MSGKRGSQFLISRRTSTTGMFSGSQELLLHPHISHTLLGSMQNFSSSSSQSQICEIMLRILFSMTISLRGKETQAFTNPATISTTNTHCLENQYIKKKKKGFCRVLRLCMVLHITFHRIGQIETWRIS